ncbi:MAG: DUF2784 domain-containing protein [Planctomycetia bacterium]|nr:DUF2784 domain-containing protein [Planctomycetia bacterium]
MLFKLAADVVVVVHVGYVAFVVLGQLVVLIGVLFRWDWVRNRAFRWLHMAAIAIVVAEALAGVVCPLTTLESWLRTQAGHATYQGDFLGHWAHELLFYDAPPWVFTLIYAAFGALVLATFIVAPPRKRAAPPPKS